jgi:hypothetical protein
VSLTTLVSGSDFRKAEESDYPLLTDWLTSEDNDAVHLIRPEVETWVIGEPPIGFFSYDIQHGIFPNLVYWYVIPEKRSLDLFRIMVEEYKTILRTQGYGKGIIHGRNDRPRIDNMLKWFFKTEPYSETEDKKFYLLSTEV